jgi:hypothetical protein
VAKSNSDRQSPAANKLAPKSQQSAALDPFDPLSPPPAPNGKQKLALAFMSLTILGWLAFLAAMALRK